MSNIYRIKDQEILILLAGGLSGGLSKTAVAPLSRIKLLYQVHHMNSSGVSKHYNPNGVLGMCRQIIEKEGFWAFWKGNGTMILKKFPYSAVKYLSYEEFKNILSPYKQQASPFVTFTSGCLAAATAVLITYPLDLVQVQLTAQLHHTSSHAPHYRGLFHALYSISRHEGPLALYRGLGAGLVTVVPYLGISLSIWEVLKKQMEEFWRERSRRVQGNRAGMWKEGSTSALHAAENEAQQGVAYQGQILSKNREKAGEEEEVEPSNQQRVWMAAAAGAVAGVVASTVTFPMDVVRRHLQLNRRQGGLSTGQREYEGFVDCVKKIHARHGVRGFYKGLYVHYWTVVPSVALSLGSYDMFKVLLNIKERRRPPSSLM